MLDRIFGLSLHQTTVRRELLAGLTTFLTMSYILFVQPAILSVDFAGNPTGLSADAVLLATCLASAFATFVMGCYARYPIALAPGMGQNAFFVSVLMATAAGGSDAAWQTTLGIVFVSGIVFLMLTWVGVREWILDSLSASLRSAIAVGIGVFIAFIGLRNGGIIVDHPATLVQLDHGGLMTPRWGVFWGGFLVTALLVARRMPGAILGGIVAAAVFALALGEIQLPERLLGLPGDHAILQLDVVGALRWEFVPFVILFLYTDIFDTMGTLIGVTQLAGLAPGGRLDRARQAMFADAAGTIAGACLGTSTVTSYIESAAGVEQGGRTGLTAFTVSVLFLLALPLTPLIAVIGSYAPITAPALVLVGSMMMRGVRQIEWADSTESIPSFLIILGIPLTFSIADGISLGLMIYPLLKIAAGRRSEVHPTLAVLVVILVVCFVARTFT